MNKTDRWHVYMIECSKGELYVGIAKDVEARIILHNKGLACRYTKYRRPVKLLFKEMCEDYRSARKREKSIKGLTRAKKVMLLA